MSILQLTVRENQQSTNKWNLFLMRHLEETLLMYFFPAGDVHALKMQTQDKDYKRRDDANYRQSNGPPPGDRGNSRTLQERTIHMGVLPGGSCMGRLQHMFTFFPLPLGCLLMAITRRCARNNRKKAWKRSGAMFVFGCRRGSAILPVERHLAYEWGLCHRSTLRRRLHSQAHPWSGDSGLCCQPFLRALGRGFSLRIVRMLGNHNDN